MSSKSSRKRVRPAQHPSVPAMMLFCPTEANAVVLHGCVGCCDSMHPSPHCSVARVFDWLWRWQAGTKRTRSRRTRSFGLTPGMTTALETTSASGCDGS